MPVTFWAQADFPELPEALLAALGAALAAAVSLGLQAAPADPVLLCRVGDTTCATACAALQSTCLWGGLC